MKDGNVGDMGQTTDLNKVDGGSPQGTAPVDAGKGKVEFTPEQQAKVDEIIKTRTEDYRNQVKSVKEELEDVKALLEQEPEEPQKPKDLTTEEWNNLSDKEKIKSAAQEVVSPELNRANESAKLAFQKSVDVEWKLFKMEHKDITPEVEGTMKKLFKSGRVQTFEDAYKIADDKNLDKEKLETEIREKIKKEAEAEVEAAKTLRGGGSNLPKGKTPLTMEEAFAQATGGAK